MMVEWSCSVSFARNCCPGFGTRNSSIAYAVNSVRSQSLPWKLPTMKSRLNTLIAVWQRVFMEVRLIF